MKWDASCFRVKNANVSVPFSLLLLGEAELIKEIIKP